MNSLAPRREIAMRLAIIFFVLVVLAFLFIDYNLRAGQYNRVVEDRERVAAQKLVRQQTQAALSTQIAYATSAVAVREYGYTSRKYQNGDIPVVVVNPDVITPTAIPLVVSKVTETSNWQHWLSLFVNPP